MDRKIFLKREKIQVGCGSTAKNLFQENYYEVMEVGEDHYEALLLDMNDRPMGKPMVIRKEDLKDYLYCPDYPKEKEESREMKGLIVEKRIQLGDRYFDDKKYFSAEHQYNKALSLDQNNLRANLGKGKTLYAQGEKNEARQFFKKLSNSEALFEKENKHIFNELGIELRKKGMLEEAITNYLRAISIDPHDEVLFYNLGRTYYEQGNRDDAIEQLKVALSRNPGFEHAKRLLATIESE